MNDKETTIYSDKVEGVEGNFNQPVMFDNTGGFIGITQYDDTDRPQDRVLLSPRQVKELFGFATGRTMKVEDVGRSPE